MSKIMEVVSVLQYLDNKSILVTGAAGFLANIFEEKILRVSPNVKKLYLLLRASNEKSANQRFNDEILKKDLYKVVKAKYGPNLNQLTSEKITIVNGDICLENLGIQDLDLTHELIHQVDVIVNLAATTKFDERYDIALGINPLGALNVLNFAKRCSKMPADMVVNSILVAMAAPANKQKETIYHIGSSFRNPCRNKVFPEAAYRYFTSKPWIEKDGKPVMVKKIEILSSMSSFHTYMALHYSITLKGLELANMIFCKLLDKNLREYQRKFNFVLRLVDLYKPYIFFNGVFEDTNAANLQRMVSKMETEMFDFDPKDINWDDYIEKLHIPGLVRYVF